MLNKFMTDLKSPKLRYPIDDDTNSPLLRYYYFKFEEKRVAAGKDQKLISKFDNDGIPINKTYIDVQDKEYVYFPISIGQMGLSIYHTFLESNSEQDKSRFLKFVEWFYNNAEDDEKLGIRWMTDVALPQYKNPGPWQSAFAQSRGISLLLRGYQLTNDIKYANYAEKSLIPFTFPVAEGGVTSFTDFGPFYEEYSAEVPTLVLNGMIFSLFGILDYARVFPENILTQKLLSEGIETLENILPEYDLSYWSRYNLCEASWYPKIDPATIGYQRLHIAQLLIMYRITQKSIFKTYADKFSEQDTIKNAVHMYRQKYKSLKMIGRL